MKKILSNFVKTYSPAMFPLLWGYFAYIIVGAESLFYIVIMGVVASLVCGNPFLGWLRKKMNQWAIENKDAWND